MDLSLIFNSLRVTHPLQMASFSNRSIIILYQCRGWSLEHVFIVPFIYHSSNFAAVFSGNTNNRFSRREGSMKSEGVDWHPNLRMEQNLITHGDLPRIVMDSYEECRGPPRLFLLDKLDVVGAGACLKRYTDPSFVKVEATSFGLPALDVQIEKKIRKVKAFSKDFG
ncbi:hypothetical protein MANES_09G113375v8 [Manihot esculenta]|uniref:Uncharacterized protein n=1 Tax=Manihot esculenta TaxID=3983 RepID=A0ACB7H5H2_MANES|nr:hypothetical protein MANES_09G113375v8 [Manihot esculenta]